MSFLKAVPFVCLALLARAQAPRIACAEDANMGAAEKIIDSAAMQFMQTLLGDDPVAAYDAMSQAGREATTRDQLEAQARLARELKPKNLSVFHSYFIEFYTRDKKAGQEHSETFPANGEPAQVVCANDLTKPDGWVSLKIANFPKQAHVLLSADAPNNKLAIALWLVPEPSGWKIQGSSVKPATLADKDSMELWQEAREQDQRGNKWNAALLYAAAQQLADRGPNFQLGLAQTISEDMAHFVKPPELRGEPPFLWKSDRTRWKILNVGLIAVGGKIYVEISHEVSPWKTDAQVDGWNRALLSYCKARFPGYSDAFAGLVASAQERGTARGYRTVDESRSSK